MPSLPFDDSATFTPPSAFGPYRVLHQIGSGVLGPVFRTYDPQSDRLVAIKAFRLELLPEDIARLADGLRRLVGTNGHIAAGLEGTMAYLAMEYYAAETLDVALRHLAPAPMESALPILRGIAEAIDHAWTDGPAHGHGSLHPRDVFVTPGTSEVGVTGCGIAHALESIGARAPIRRPYTAPERTTGGAWDARADVYSLGAIAHELLTGRRPAGPGEQDGSLPATMAPELRVQLRRVLSKALAESPAQRFATCAEFVRALADPSSLPDAESTPLTPADVLTVLPSAAPTPVSHDPEPDAPRMGTESLEAGAAPAPARRRTRMAAPAARPAAKVAVPDAPAALETAAPAEAEPVISLGDAPLRPASVMDSPLRTDSSPRLAPSQVPLPLPPSFPWAAIGAVAVACLVLGAAIDHQFFLPHATTPAPATSPAAAPPKGDAAVPAAPTTPVAGDTEVAVSQPPAAASAASGHIVIRSTPAGAAVTLDGKPSGRTPFTSPGLALAGHTVVVARPGFETETRQVTLTSAAPSATLQITLKAERPAPAAKGATTGSLNVDSRPKGARVTMDGRSLGSTPLSVPGLKPGVHSVRVELPGYKVLTTTVTVKAGETAKLAVTLERQSEAR